MVYNTYVLPIMKQHEAKIAEYERMAADKFNEAKTKAQDYTQAKKDE